jgi:hypothetical protein
VFGVNSYHSAMYLFTSDGLFLATLGGDTRTRPCLRANEERRGMILNGYAYGGEHFWPNLTQVPGEGIYLVAGHEYSGVQTLTGFDTVRRIQPFSVRVTSGMLAALPETREEQLQRQKGGRPERPTARLTVRADAVTVDGRLDDWRDTPWMTLDSSRDIRAAVAIDDATLFAAWETGMPELLDNRSGELATLFADGGGLELSIGTEAPPDQGRRGNYFHHGQRLNQPKPGDVRLFVTRRGNPRTGPIVAALYEQVAESEGQSRGESYESPIGTVTLARVEPVADQVQLAQRDGDFELAIPLATLGFTPQEGKRYLGDIGIIIGDGTEATARLYWSAKNATMVSDLPSEAELKAALWGIWERPKANADEEHARGRPAPQ